MDLESTVSGLMDDLWETLDELVSFASVNTGNQSSEHPVTKCRASIITKFENAGINAKELSITYKNRTATPLVYANCKSKRTNAPTVLIYSHYDVQPATKAGWDTDPFTPVNKQDGKDTRKYGRGAADVSAQRPVTGPHRRDGAVAATDDARKVPARGDGGLASGPHQRPVMTGAFVSIRDRRSARR